MTWFPEDFQEESMIQRTRRIFQSIIDRQQQAFSAKLTQLLSTLTSHLAAIKKHEAFLESLEENAKANESVGVDS